MNGIKMDIIQISIGILLGILVLPSVTWLSFVYPYSDISLKMAWIGFGLGLFFGLILVLVYLFLFSNGWPTD